MAQLLNRLLQSFGYRVVSRRHSVWGQLVHPPRSLFDLLLQRNFPELDGLSFIQVGANDGTRVDPINPYVRAHRWKGVLLEPVPVYFQALQCTYAGLPALTLLPAALDHQTGFRTIYHVNPTIEQPVPDWVWGLASFDRERVLATLHDLGLPSDAMVEDKVATVTWNEVLRLLPGAQCDMLVLDTEGYDIPLLRMAPLKQMRPRLIHFEHACHPREMQLAFYGELFDLGYEIATEAQDTTAVLQR